MAPINTRNKSNVGKIAIIVISGSSWKLTLAPVFDLCLRDDALPLAMLEQSYKHSTIWCVWDERVKELNKEGRELDITGSRFEGNYTGDRWSTEDPPTFKSRQ